MVIHHDLGRATMKGGGFDPTPKAWCLPTICDGRPVIRQLRTTTLYLTLASTQPALYYCPQLKTESWTRVLQGERGCPERWMQISCNHTLWNWIQEIQALVSSMKGPLEVDHHWTASWGNHKLLLLLSMREEGASDRYWHSDRRTFSRHRICREWRELAYCLGCDPWLMISRARRPSLLLVSLGQLLSAAY